MSGTFRVRCWAVSAAPPALSVPDSLAEVLHPLSETPEWAAAVQWQPDGAAKLVDLHQVSGCSCEGEAISLAWAWVATLYLGVARAVGTRPVGDLNWSDLTDRQIAHLARLGGG